MNTNSPAEKNTSHHRRSRRQSDGETTAWPSTLFFRARRASLSWWFSCPVHTEGERAEADNAIQWLPSNHPSVRWCAAATAAAFINGKKSRPLYVNAANRARLKSHVSYRRQSAHEGIQRRLFYRVAAGRREGKKRRTIRHDGWIRADKPG